MSDQRTLFGARRPLWWKDEDEARVREFYANGEGPLEQTEVCRLCRHWQSLDGKRGGCNDPSRELIVASAGDTCGAWMPAALP